MQNLCSDLQSLNTDYIYWFTVMIMKIEFEYNDKNAHAFKTTWRISKEEVIILQTSSLMLCFMHVHRL